MNHIQIITTSDGSHSLLNTELNETYHSVHGALQESQHVFIKNGFDFVYQNTTTDPIEILEVGFGTGLNALLTLQRALEIDRKIIYTTLETNPLPGEIWSKLNYSSSDTLQHYFEKLHTAAWNEAAGVQQNFTLLKLQREVQQVDFLSSHYDLIYYDAFAPSKQPEMWSLSVFQKVVAKMQHGATLVTYCAKGQVKRDLKSLGLHVETLIGPPGKKEMIRATKK